ncbi:MAG: hypothetical protein ACLR0P_14130 [Oscillospiraceae bacterium]
MEWIWYFIWYSFLGFLLEVGYARWTGGRRDRKCLLLPFPVSGVRPGDSVQCFCCPVGAGAALCWWWREEAAATGVEYGISSVL